VHKLTVSAEKIATYYESLDRIGCLGDPRKDGFLRPSWSEEEDRAMQVMIDAAKKLGLTPRYDAVGNLVLEIAGTEPTFVETGSHLDTVVRGGNFDGAAGIVAGIAAIEQILSSGQARTKGLRLRIWRGEESGTYALFCKGSLAAFGKLPPKALEAEFKGKKLRDAIRERGYDTGPIERGEPTIAQPEIDSIAAHIELHIEQANFLEREKLDVGLVTSIRAPIRHRIFLEGSFDHSGGTPMGTEYRRDVNLALSYIGVELDKLGKQRIDDGFDLVQTIGVINSDPGINAKDDRVYQNATAKVSGFGYFHYELRSSDLAFKKRYTDEALAKIRTVCESFRVKPTIELISDGEPIEALDQSILDSLVVSAEVLQLKSAKIPSGAVHDCLHVGHQKKSSGQPVPIGMIFIPCRDGISHSPEEFSTNEEIARGASVLATSMLALAR
jgi:hydantoinase/carbamoylase family amidase